MNFVNMRVMRYDVAILGLGPVGCTAAILLSHAGLKVAAVERDREVYRLPRAVNLDGEIVRAMQPLGIAETLNDLLQTVRPGERAGFANSRREFLFGNDARPRGLNGWQPLNMFDQPEVEGFLRQTALAQPTVTSFVGYAASHHEQDADTVRLTIAPVDEAAAPASQTIEADYLIGCDGAASETRRQLGAEWRDLGYDHDWLVVDVIVREVDRISELLDQLMVFARGDELKLAPVNIHRVLDDVLTLLGMDPLSKGIAVQRIYDPSIPELVADADRLTQVFESGFDEIAVFLPVRALEQLDLLAEKVLPQFQ